MCAFFFSPVLLAIGALIAHAAAPPVYTPDAAGFAKQAQPFFDEHCVACHGEKKQKGDLRLDTLANDFGDPATAEKWANVLNTVNAHEMPPEEKPQPAPAVAAHFAEWVTAELGRAETAKRKTTVTMRRLNRAEYNNTIRDLVGVDFNPAETFPEDPPAGGFDNIGEALSISPLHLELYYNTARQILDRALVEGDQPAAIHWHFEPDEFDNKGDGIVVKRDGLSVRVYKGGADAIENGFTLIHHASWNTPVQLRDFKVPHEGDYLFRFRAAGRVPTRDQALAAVRPMLEQRLAEAVAKGSNREYQEKENAALLAHFETGRMYDYGPPRVKVTATLGGVPRVIAEMDVPATEDAPGIYEVPVHLSAQQATLSLEYTYNIPSMLSREWLVKKEFPAPLLLVDWLELEGPVLPTWPPASHTRVLGWLPADDTLAAETKRAQEVLASFMTRAYRRPVVAEEVAPWVALFQQVRPHKRSYVEAMKVPLTAVLTSPHFLFLVEPSDPAENGRPLNSYELASRLSYFLWSSMPDEELFRLAASGDLPKPAVLSAQVNRLLASPKSSAFVTNFAGQWLSLRKVGANPPVANIYPEYDRHLETSMVRESQAFFAEILNHDLDARNLIKSDFVTINERLARFYGIPGVKGDEMRKVAAPPESHRGGVVTQAAIQCITSNGTRTSPVSRGVWVLKTMLGINPGLPVANAGDLASKVPGIGKATVRQRLQIHRESPACARCHDKIDPMGFALENFNACGEYREVEASRWDGRQQSGDPAIDASARMPDGDDFTGVEGLQKQLLKKEDLFLTSLTKQLLTYALGRELGFSDQPRVQACAAAMKKDGYTLRALIQAIVASDRFATK